MIKRGFAFVMALLLVLSLLTGCGSGEQALGGGDVDVDLTLLSSTMVYSEVYNMLAEPEQYLGKTVRMSGMFVVYSNEDHSRFYPAVIIADATACCSQGLEFILKGAPGYPEGYPPMETNITVTGVFETYEEDGTTFCHLVNSVLEPLRA